jgi:hypothetical protein
MTVKRDYYVAGLSLCMICSMAAAVVVMTVLVLMAR